MKRIPIPPTKYDPMRPVQAKMAAPAGGPRVEIPPTRYGLVGSIQARSIEAVRLRGPNPSPHLNPRPGHGRPIQRAAAAAVAAAPAGGGNVQIVANFQQAKGGDTPAMTYLRTLSLPALTAHLIAQDAVIGRDQKGHSDLAGYIKGETVRSLAAHLVATGADWSTTENGKWLDTVISDRRRVRVVGAHGKSCAVTASNVRHEKPGNTQEEANNLIHAEYVWDGVSEMNWHGAVVVATARPKLVLKPKSALQAPAAPAAPAAAKK